MSYEVIEKNEYGVLVIDKKDQFENYLSDQEAAKLETENHKTIEEIYQLVKSEDICQCGNLSIEYLEKHIKNSDSQKELLDLQNENKQLKDMVNELETYLDEAIRESGYALESHAYKNVKEFIKNQK